jgi:hypothetical protein
MVDLAQPDHGQQAVRSAGPGEREAQQGGIDPQGLLEGFDVEREIDQGVECADRADIACFGSLC